MKILRVKPGTDYKLSLEQAAQNGITELAVQPTHLLKGKSYELLEKAVAACRIHFKKLVLAEPVLSSEEDFNQLMGVLISEACRYDDGKTALCFVGHGSSEPVNDVYIKCQHAFDQAGCGHCYVGTIEAEPGFEDVQRRIDCRGIYEKIVLFPLMISVGYHVKKDIAGENEGSWRKRFEACGYQVSCVLRGLETFPEIQQIYDRHLESAAAERMED